MINRIKLLIKEICMQLKIKEVNLKVSYDLSIFPKGYNQFVINVKNRTIYLNNKNMPDKIDYDLIFSIAHECRHQWQFDNNNLNVSEYVKSDKLNIEDYNSQEAELDANAFGYAFMVENFGVKPLFKSFSSELTEKIIQKSKTIKLC